MDSGTARHGESGSSLVDLGRLAQSDALALEIKRRILAHPLGSTPERAFSRMWGTVVVVRREVAALSGTGLRELTLRFDYGRLVVHDGRVGRPDISLWGTDAQLLSLAEVVSRKGPTGEAVSLSDTAQRWWAMGRLISRVSSDSASAARLQIFGGLGHPRLLYRLALVLSG